MVQVLGVVRKDLTEQSWCSNILLMYFTRLSLFRYSFFKFFLNDSSVTLIAVFLASEYYILFTTPHGTGFWLK